MLEIEGFLKNIHKSEKTQRAYRETLLRFQNFLDGKEPTEDRARGFIAQLKDKGLKPSSICRHGYALRKYFQWARIPLNLELPSIPTRVPRWLDKKQIQALIIAARNPLERALIMLLYDSATRISEVLSLKKEDIDWDGGFIRIIGKGEREAWVPVGEATLGALQQYLKWYKGKSEYLFPFSYYDVRKWLNGAAKRAGIENFHPHILRHSRASNLRLDGTPIEDLRDLLRHVNINTTMIYAHLKPKELKRKIKPAF